MSERPKRMVSGTWPSAKPSRFSFVDQRDDDSSRRRTSKTQSKEEAVEHQLLLLAKENPMRLFCVGEVRTIFHMGKKTMTRLRKLAQKDPISDPWEGDLTNPEQFAKWYWGKRRELQSQFPNI